MPAARTLEFTKRNALGILALRDSGSPPSEDGRYAGKASGPVRIPAGKEARLDIAPVAVGDLAPLADLPADGLQGLSFHTTPVVDAALSFISGLNGLLGLDLGRTRITDAGIAHIAGLKALRGLNLCRTQIGDGALDSIAGLVDLVWLNLSRTLVGDVGIAKL